MSTAQTAAINAAAPAWGNSNPLLSGGLRFNGNVTGIGGNGLLLQNAASDDGATAVQNAITADPVWGTMLLQAMHIRGQWAGYRFVYPTAGKEFQFRVDGSAYANASWSIFSDRRLKTRLEVIGGALDNVPVMF